MSYKALLFCPNERTARVLTQVLTELDFGVDPSHEPFAAVKRLITEHFDAVVVDCENEQNATLLFKSAHNSGVNQAALAVAVVEGQAGVAKAFRFGANLVLTKPINVEQAKGTLRVARGLLKKTEATKASSPTLAPAAAPPNMEAPKWPSTPEPPAPKGPITSLPAHPPATPVAAASAAFELEKEPAPAPEPAEAALLESMPDPLANRKPPAEPGLMSAKTRENPWQPGARPMAEPMANALRRAAEAAGKVEGDSSAAGNQPVSYPPIISPASTPAHIEASGHAAAPAPAREAIHAKPASAEADAPPAPLFTSLGSQRSSEPAESERSRKPLIAALVLITAAAVGYAGWTKMHSASVEAPAVSRPAAPAPPRSGQAAQLPVLPPVPGAENTGSAANQPPPSHPAEVTVEGPDITLTTAESPAKGAKPSAIPANTVKPAPSTPKPAPLEVKAPEGKPVEPILVKSEAPKAPAPEQQSAAPPDPGQLTVSGDDRAIAGIMTAPPGSTPQPAQAIKVSQGVAQGLLVKSAAPVYPPQARQMHMQGAVELTASISKDGNITSIKVVHGETMLARAAVDAVKQWKYKPYLLNGQPVEIQTQITVNFKLP